MRNNNLILIIGLLLFLTEEASARGGGRSSGGSSSWYSGGGRSYSSGGSSCGGECGPMPVWAIVLVVVLVVVVLCCTVTCWALDSEDRGGHVKVRRVPGTNILHHTVSYEGSTPCYLCLIRIKNSEWDSGEHRRKCAYRNQRELLSFPTRWDALCPNCNEKLRLWPAYGANWYCDECPYGERDRAKRSTGFNRLNCFLCDYDKCVDCADRARDRRNDHQTSSARARDIEAAPPAPAVHMATSPPSYDAAVANYADSPFPKDSKGLPYGITPTHSRPSAPPDPDEPGRFKYTVKTNPRVVL